MGLKSEMYKILGKATLKQMKKQAKKEVKKEIKKQMNIIKRGK